MLSLIGVVSKQVSVVASFFDITGRNLNFLLSICHSCETTERFGLGMMLLLDELRRGL